LRREKCFSPMKTRAQSVSTICTKPHSRRHDFPLVPAPPRRQRHRLVTGYGTHRDPLVCPSASEIRTYSASPRPLSYTWLHDPPSSPRANRRPGKSCFSPTAPTGATKGGLVVSNHYATLNLRGRPRPGRFHRVPRLFLVTGHIHLDRWHDSKISARFMLWIEAIFTARSSLSWGGPRPPARNGWHGLAATSIAGHSG